MHTFSLQTRLYSGPGSLAALQRFSHQHIWIVCDGFLARSPLLDRLRAALPPATASACSAILHRIRLFTPWRKG
ncbi:propanediol utilization protein PduQ [Klebsiella pneumoniae]|nr:propanediol utilization protein PduQ [Klebsiella pneumoniae]